MRGRTTRLAGIVSAFATVTVLASASAAQVWRGDATLGMACKSGKGSTLQGALVTLAYRDIGFGDGPAARLTDTRGEVNFTGLSAGTWSLKIDHPDHLSYLATLVIRRGKKPQILTEFLEATGPGRQTIRVKMLKGVSGDRGVVVKASRPRAQPATAAAPAETETPNERESTSVVEKVTDPTQRAAPATDTQPTSATAALSGMAEDSGSDDSATMPDEAIDEASESPPTGSQGPSETVIAPVTPSSDALAAVTAVPSGQVGQAAGEQPVDPVSEPAANDALTTPPAEATADPTEPTPQQEITETGTEPSETANSATELSTPPLPEADTPPTKATNQQVAAAPASVEAAALLPDREALRAYGDRSCLECKPGEWSVTSAVHADAADGSACPEPSESRVRDSVENVALELADRLYRYAGPLLLDVVDRPGSLAQLSGGSCRLVAVVVPGGARFTGFTFHAADAMSGGDCIGDQECDIGSARWLFNPGIIRVNGATVVFSVFNNGSSNAARKGSLIAYFVPRPGWTPEP